jgi:hypothetical protein
MESPTRASDQGQPATTDVDLQPHRDLSEYSNPQLRAMVASAQELARRAAGELRERKTPFPRCLSPHHVMAFLPLGDIPWALRVSSAWRAAAEATFQVVARENGLERAGTWRAAVRSAAREIRWVASLHGKRWAVHYQWKELNGPATITGRLDRYTAESLLYVRGRAIRLRPGWTTSWQVKLEKGDAASEHDLNAFGFAILDPINPGKVLVAYEWNEDGLPFYEERGRNAGFHVRELRGDGRGRPFFEGGDSIRIQVTHKGNSIAAAVTVDSDTSEFPRIKRHEIEIEDSDSDSEDEEYTRTKILRLLPRKRDGRMDEVNNVYGQEKTLVVAPFCDLANSSSATLMWSAVAQGLGPTWRIYKKASATGSYGGPLSDAAGSDDG